MSKKLKLFVIFTLVYLTAYGPAELTRCIIQFNFPQWADVSYLELAMMWGMYLGFMVALSSIIWRVKTP